MNGAVDAAAVREALQARKDSIVANFESMTLKSCRKQLEEDLGLERDALKPFKEVISKGIDDIIAEQTKQSAQGDEPKGEKKRKGKGGKEKAAAPEGGKRQRTAEQGDEAKPAAGPRKYSKRVEKLRTICRQASITIPPSTYRSKEDAQLAAALEALLEKHGLDAHSGEKEIQKAKQRLQTERDLDGIDTSNIVEGGRRRRTAALVSYSDAMPASSEEDDEAGDESGDSSGSEDDAGSDASGSPAAEQPKRSARAVVASESKEDSEHSADSASEEEEENRAQHKQPASPPNENKLPNSTKQHSGKNPEAKAAAAEAEHAAKQPRKVLAAWSDDDEDF